MHGRRDLCIDGENTSVPLERVPSGPLPEHPPVVQATAVLPDYPGWPDQCLDQGLRKGPLVAGVLPPLAMGA